MKEFVMKHPFISLLALDIVVTGVINTIRSFTCKDCGKVTEEATENESAGTV